METQNLINSLSSFGPKLSALVATVSNSDAVWKPESGNWSILEIVCHLLGEERCDFRPRIQSIFEDPEKPWVSWDPKRHSVEKKYNEQDLHKTLAKFLQDRRDSLAWLNSLSEPDWSQAYLHPQLGKISAGDLLGSWAAHDCLHICQIGKRLYEIAERNSNPFAIGYAGNRPA